MITIVILIILAGVTLNITLGENGIFQKSKEAVDSYQEAAKREESELDEVLGELSGYYNAKTQTETVDGLTQAELQEEIANGTRILHQNPVIPEGYSAVQTDSASWATETANGKTYVKGWNNGLVIKDSKGNEWVWVPVELDEDGKASEMYTEGEYTINGATGTKYSKLYDFTAEGRTLKTTPMLPTGTSFREPGYLSTYEGNSTYYGTGTSGAGFSSSEEMTKYFVSDYEAMITSVEKYGGFYIGRYELSGTVENPTVVRGVMPLTNTNWYRLNLACRSLGTDSTTSTMIWGTQWDATLEWLVDSGAKTYAELKDSTSWGNYYNAAFQYTGEDGQTYTKYREEEVEGYYDENGEYKYNLIDENGNIEYYYIDNDNSVYTYYKADGTVVCSLDDNDEGVYTVNGTTYTWDSNKQGYYNSNGEEYINTIYPSLKIPTGATERNQANNIYDLAGNIWDWTQEAINSIVRVYRGGAYNSFGSGHPASSRSGSTACDSSGSGSRATLYIK